MNKVFLHGRLGQPAELKILGNDQQVLNFSLATSENWKDKSGAKQERTTWHRCQLWGTRAVALAPYLLKGTELIVEGSIENKVVEKDGQKTTFSSVKVSNVEFAGGGKKTESAPADTTDGLPVVEDSEIPF